MVIKRRDFLKYMGYGVAASGMSGFINCSTTKDQKPNFILINVDDLGWTDLSCFGSEYYETPNIDRLAEQGMKFTNAYASCAVCSPTRASLMTGRYPARIGVTDWIHHIDKEGYESYEKRENPSEYAGNENRSLLCPPNPYWMELDELTIAEMLKEAGYVTCHVGKWHLGYEPWFPEKQGFDYNYGGTEIGQPPSYFDPYHLNERRPDISTLPPREEGEYLTDRESDEAVSFIRNNRDKNFFLNMCHYAVHTPLEAKEDLKQKYEEKPKTNQTNVTYAAMIESVDNAVGRLIDVLEETGLSENTVIIFTSDNGGLLGHSTDNSPLRSGKGYPYEGGIRVPLIVKWNNVVEPGTLNETPVTSTDYFPTICDAADIELPIGREIDGISIMPVLENSGSINRESLFWHFPHYRGRDVVPYSIVRKDDWKLIKRYEGKEFELFNLKDDLSEQTDLSGQMSDKVRELDDELKRWLNETNAKVPTKNPDFKGN
ncbi:MAG: sulfatase [bacterium]|nr:sulfatase [bacterium]